MPESGTFEQRLAVSDTYWFVGTDPFQQPQQELDRLELGYRVEQVLDFGSFLFWPGTPTQETTGFRWIRAENAAVTDWLLEHSGTAE